MNVALYGSIIQENHNHGNVTAQNHPIRRNDRISQCKTVLGRKGNEAMKSNRNGNKTSKRPIEKRIGTYTSFNPFSPTNQHLCKQCRSRYGSS